MRSPAPRHVHLLATAVMAVIALALQPTRAEDLAGIVIAPETEADYDRTRDYGSGWRDDDGDCQDARQEVLITEALAPVTLTANGCRVTAGVWFDPFTGELFTTPFHMDVDHLVPLKEAHDSGAHAWERSERVAYANDLTNPGHLIAVDASANRSKGARDPAEWLPYRHLHAIVEDPLRRPCQHFARTWSCSGSAVWSLHSRCSSGP